MTLAILVFGPLATGAVRTPDLLVLQTLTIGATGLWIFRLWLSDKPRLLWPPICWAVLVFAVYAVARYFTADIEYTARQEVIRVVIYTLIFFVVLNNLHRQESIRIITFTLVFLAVAISFYALYQFLTGSDRVWTFISPYKHRAGGTYICPNHLAGFLEMLLPLALAYAVASRLKLPLRIMLGYAALVMVAGIVVTLSRGGWLACAASLLLFGALLFFRRNLRWPVVVAFLFVAALAVFFIARSPSVRFRIEKSFSQTQEVKSVENIRFELWPPATRMWRDNFWFGVGPAHFDQRFQAYRPQIIQVRPERTHNDYLNTLVDWGVVGAAIVVSAWTLLALGIFKSWKFVRGNARDLGSNQSDKFAFVLGASVGLVAILLHSVVDFNMSIPANAILAVTLMALLTSHLRFATEGYWFTAQVGVKIILTLALLAAVAWLGAQGMQRAREYFWLHRAKHAPVFSLAQIEALKRAFAVEPKNFDTAYALGEAFRIRCMDGNPNYAELGQQSLEWYARGAALQPFASDFPLGRGIALDFLDRHDEAATAFAHADRLDPNGAFTAAYVGWHHVQVGNYAAARPWFVRALMLDQLNTPMATRYLNLVDRRLREAAAQH